MRFPTSRRMLFGPVAPRLLTLTAALCLAACEGAAPPVSEDDGIGVGRPIPPEGTPELREALFEEVMDRTREREAFSAIKESRLGFDPLADMKGYRSAVIGAKSGPALFYAFAQMSNARHDRHLEIALLPGGLELGDSAGIAVVGQDEPAPSREAPLRLLPDFGSDKEYGLFVADYAWERGRRVSEDTWGARPGDRVLAVNGRSLAEYAEAVRPYTRYSTEDGFWWRLAVAATERTATLPPTFYADSLTLTVERSGGEMSVRLPYFAPDTLEWAALSEPSYPGFYLALETPTFDLHRRDSGEPITLLRWHGFRETLVDDVNAMIEYASARGLLEGALIVDVTRSRGGSKGAYALQHMVNRPFRTTLGNLRLSDVTQPFIDRKRREFEERLVDDSGVGETLDGGAWLMDWLDHDVADGLAAGDAYSNDVPFKLAHAPRTSDGTLRPASRRFRGPLVVLSGPRRGSHVDQFVAVVKDNALGHVIGMPAAGYSNTWEWEETLTYPGTDRPVVQFMWSIGHTLRPNGEVLEGNPAEPDDRVPLTAANFREYYAILLRRALDHIGAS